MFTTLRGTLRLMLALGALLPAASVLAADLSLKALPTPDWDETRDQTFSLVWETVNQSYYDPTFGGVDWVAVREKYRARLTDAANKEQLRWLLTAMLGELHHTHFSILPREAAVFTPAERVRVGTIGANFTCAGDQVIVTQVQAEQAAAKEALKPGDRVLAINGIDLATADKALEQAKVAKNRREFYLQSIVNGRSRAAVGSEVKLKVESVDGTTRDVGLKTAANLGRWSEPMGSFPSCPLEFEAKRMADHIDYLSFNLFAPSLMKDIRPFLLQLRPGDGLVIDLRGNPGGITVMASGISGWLTDKECSLGTMHLRQGRLDFEVWPQDGAFLGPVAILVDGGSASTSEVLAAGLQALGRARVFGEMSAGAALPSAFITLPTGDLFQYAIADLQMPDGHLLEGHGVVPDETIKRTQADIAAGRDPVLLAARAWIERERQTEESAPGSPKPAP